MRFKTRTRQLANGKWVGEYKRGLFFGKWFAADSLHAEHKWAPGDTYYGHCHVETEQEAQQILTNHLSARWGI